jgi:hypothetical protein
MVEINNVNEQTVSDSDNQPPINKTLTREQVRNALLGKTFDSDPEMEKINVAKFTPREAKLFFDLILKYSFSLLLKLPEESNISTIQAFTKHKLGHPNKLIQEEELETYKPIIKKLADFGKRSSITETTSLAFRHVQQDTTELAEKVISDAEIYGGKSPDKQGDVGICVEFGNTNKIDDDYLRRDKANILFVYDAAKLVQLTADEMVTSSNWAAGYGVKAAEGYTLRDTILGIIMLESIN